MIDDPMSAILSIKQSADTAKSVFDAVKSFRSTFKGDKKASGELDHIANQLIALRDSLISAQELIQDLQYRLSLESDKVRFLKEKLGEVEKTKAERLC